MFSWAAVFMEMFLDASTSSKMYFVVFIETRFPELLFFLNVVSGIDLNAFFFILYKYAAPSYGSHGVVPKCGII